MKQPLAEPEYQAGVFLIPAEGVEEVWEYCAPFLHRALSHSLGEFSLDDLRNICVKGIGALLAFTDPRGFVVGAAVTQILDHEDGRRVCRILAYGANDWNATRHCLGEVEEAARQAGAKVVHFNGRPGWGRLCQPMGYRLAQVIMEKVL